MFDTAETQRSERPVAGAASHDRPRDAGRFALTVASALAATLPVIVSTIRGLAEHWVPSGDQAVIAARAYDVLSSHSPLLGQFSATSGLTGRPTYSLGPLLYWLLAVPARLGPPAAIALTIGLVNAACVAGAVLIARSRGGPALMLATAFGLAVMCGSLAPEILHDPWNPSAAVLPFTLLIFSSWSLACGDRRQLPLAVLLASFVTQCHLVYALPSFSLLTIAAAGAITRPRPCSRRWPIAAVTVAVVCWSAPIVDEIEHRPGNLALVLRAAIGRQPSAGWQRGWHALVHAVGMPPWWVERPGSPFHALADVAGAPALTAVAGCALILFALVTLLAWSVRERRGELAAACAIALLLCASLAVVTAETPARPALMATLGYTLWWGSPAGMWCWLVVGFGTVTAIRARPPAVLRSRRPALAAATAAAALAAAATVAVREGPDQHRSAYRAVGTLARLVKPALPGGSTVWLDGSPDTTVMRAGLRYELRADGTWALGIGAARWGPAYDLAGRRVGYVVYLADGSDRRPGRSIGRVSAVPGVGGQSIDVSVHRCRAPSDGACRPAPAS